MTTLCVMLFVAGCQDNGRETELTALQNRISRLEIAQESARTKLDEMSAKFAEAKVTSAPVTPPPALAYELLGAGSSARQYPTLSRCEAAKRVFLNERNAKFAEEEARGIQVLTSAQVTCLPL